jgi:23S rRNA (guanine745-N1)-methyltransferase
LKRNEKVCQCTGQKVHCFDVAKSGYLNLSGPRGGEGDSKDAVRARRLFLDAGYYRPLCDRIEEILTSHGIQSVLDAGCGEGYYTNRLAMNRTAVGIDLSRAGIEVASKRANAAGSRAGFAVAGLFAMPVADGTMDGVINLFAPCAEEEFLRVLKPGGILVLVGAGERHLMGLKQVLYADPYLNPGQRISPNLQSRSRKNA